MRNTRKTFKEIRAIVSGVFLENPFVKNWTIWVTQRPMHGYLHKTTGKEATFKSENITYLSLDPSAEFRDRLLGLSKGALHLYLWMSFELEIGKDRVWLNREKYKKKAGGIGDRSLNESIKELIEVNLIREVMDSEVLIREEIWPVYFMNPIHIFRGARKNAFEENVKTREYVAGKDKDI